MNSLGGAPCCAHAAFPKGDKYLRLADELDALFTDDAFLALFPTRGQRAQPPWQLALGTILQCAEGLSYRQAANAVRSRLDWKYVLRPELTDPGFDASVLSEFLAACWPGRRSLFCLTGRSRGVATVNSLRKAGDSRERTV